MTKHLTLRLCTRWGGCPSQSLLSTPCPRGSGNKKDSGSSNLFGGLADSQLQRCDAGSESIFPTQIRDIVTHRDRELKSTIQSSIWKIRKLESCNKERSVPRQRSGLRESSREGGEMCGHTECRRDVYKGVLTET